MNAPLGLRVARILEVADLPESAWRDTHPNPDEVKLIPAYSDAPEALARLRAANYVCRFDGFCILVSVLA